MELPRAALLQITQVKLSPLQHRIVCLVWVYTYGNSEPSCSMSLGFLSGCLGVNRRSVQKELDELVKGNILIQEISKEKERTLSFNENYTSWCSLWDYTKLDEGSREEHEELFNKVWALYPCKRGKAQVSSKKKEVLFRVGYEKLQVAVERYLKETSKEYYVNGSTFFNSRYVDFLDENYTGPFKRKEKTAVNAGNFEQREYSDEFYDSLYANAKVKK